MTSPCMEIHLVQFLITGSYAVGIKYKITCFTAYHASLDIGILYISETIYYIIIRIFFHIQSNGVVPLSEYFTRNHDRNNKT
jgi:hypothetical protein